MKTYKNFYGTKAEYIDWLIGEIKRWSKTFADAKDTMLRDNWCEHLDNLEQALANEGWGWDDIEALEIAAY